MERPLTILGVPMDLGADRRGVDMGPSAIRYAGLAEALEALELVCADGGDLRVPRPEETDPHTGAPPGGRAKYLSATRDVCTRLSTRVADVVGNDSVPLVLGGDHSIGIGTIGGVARTHETGVLWFDAHADFNTPETSPSGNVHGMPLAAVLGEGTFAASEWATAPAVPAENVALVGVRDVDPTERPELEDSDVTVFTMTDIDHRGITDVVESAIDIVTDGVDHLHVSLDLDWLDPTEAPGVGTPVRGGVSYREAHAAMERLQTLDAELTSMELVEVNPILDEHNRTAELAVELAASALGRSIL